MGFVHRISHQITYLVSQLDLKSSLFVVGCVVVVGVLCMRGFGSRSNY